MAVIPIFHVDAFVTGPFTGNPAAVCLLEEWLPDRVLQNIASENNLAETAFLMPDKDNYKIRWFTPVVEVDLCGHATLASAYVVMNILKPDKKRVIFHSRERGDLYVTLKDDMLELDFPTDTLRKCVLPALVEESLGVDVIESYAGRSDYLVLVATEADVRKARPDFGRLASADGRGVMVTARGSDVDFVSRFFAPQAGINEDPVTGSAHTTLTPFWSERFGKMNLTAKQLSARGGYLECTLNKDRTLIAGKASLYLKGEILIHL